MKKYYLLILILFVLLNANSQTISGELKKWHRVAFTFDGPIVDESDITNPFRDYRMIVTFTGPSNQVYNVPGFFAADGDAANTSATSGNKWRAYFAPDEIGEWSYTTSFRTGTDIAVSTNLTEGSPLSFDNTNGTITILPTDKTGNDNRGKGRLNYVNERYLQFAETNQYFIKVGTDSPENLLAYEDFDDTYNLSGNNFIKSWSPHIGDWTTGDPTWNTDKGKGLIGAINYLASKGMNAFSFIPMNIDGDGDDVWPWVNENSRDRFDVSKLEQWEIIFDHGDRKGMFMHFKTQERENDHLLNNGDLGIERKLYYRELIARFGHHLALNWNLGEENTQTDQQRIDMAQYFFDTDPYNHHVVIHTFPGEQDLVYTPLLGNNSKLTGASIQTDISMVHDMVKTWVVNSENSGKPWCVSSDEIGGADVGVTADSDYSGNTGTVPDNRNDVRHLTLYGALLAGGYGVEYYFGYETGETDLLCEDFRSRDKKWDDAKIALDFFTDYLTFWEMQNSDNLLDNINAYCFSKANDTYVIYLPPNESTNIDLGTSGDNYEIKWFDPRSGGNLQDGSITSVMANGLVSIGNPPSDPNEDWLVLITNNSGTLYTYDNGWLPSDPNGVSTTADDIIITNGDTSINISTDCNTLTIEPGSGLTIDAGVTLTASGGVVLQSSSTAYASLILDGSVTGDVTYLRHVNISTSSGTGTINNDLISAPLVGESFGNFRAANSNIESGTIDGNLAFLFGPFNTATGNYVNYQPSDDSEILDAGEGFRTGSTDNGNYRFVGSIETGAVNIPVFSGGASNWNLIGNPYPSYLNVHDFLNNANNASLLDENAIGIYGYDGNANDGWIIFNLATTNSNTVIAPGQGFFIDAESSGSINFTASMRSTGNSDDFIAGRDSNQLVYLKLQLTSNSESYYTDFYFNDNASTDLDLGYDASVHNSIPENFSIHSYLVENDNDIAMALQALHSNDLNNVTIPLGINANSNESLEFSILESTIPNGINVYLEDTATETITLLNNENYTLVPTTALNGKGRFYLRFESQSLGLSEINLDGLQILTHQKQREVIVIGTLYDPTQFKLYDIKGRLIKSESLNLESNKNYIEVSNLPSGVYIVQLKNSFGQRTQKIILM